MEYIRHPNISSKQIERVNRQLDDGERVILVSPLDSQLSSPISMAVFAFGLIWTLFFLSLFIGKLIDYGTMSGEGILFLFLFPILGGILILMFPINVSKKAAKKIAAFTDKRVILFTDKGCFSALLKNLKRLSYVEYPGKDGTIEIISEAFPPKGHIGTLLEDPGIVLARLPDIKSIDKILRQYCQNTGVTDSVESVPWSAESLDPEAKTVIEQKLEPGESLIWAQRPEYNEVWSILVILAVLSMLVTGGVVFMEKLHSPYLIGRIFGFEIILWIVIFYFFHQRKQRIKTSCCVVTNKRAFIFRRLMFDRLEVLNFLPSTLEIISRKRRKDGSGDLVFYRRVIRPQGEESVVEKGFLNIANVDLAERAVKNLIDANSR